MVDFAEFRLNITAEDGDYFASWRTDNVQGEPFPLELPLSAKDVAELRWYFEDYLHFPGVGDRRHGEIIEERLEAWGEKICVSLFTGAEGELLRKRVEQACDSGRLVVLSLCSDDALFHAQPWELWRYRGRPLLLQGVSIRRELGASSATEPPLFASPLRILLIVSRPVDAGFIDPRSSLRPLLEALESLPEGAVDVELCEPPTLRRMRSMLSSARDSGQPFQVVHFDGHGWYDTETGKGALAFETDFRGARTEMIAGAEIGAELARAEVPVVLLEACRSSTLSDRPVYSSVAPALLASGVGSVVAFSYSVHVAATRLLMESFYRELAGGRTVGEALQRARRVLFDDRRRWVEPGPDGDVVELQDWSIVQLYQVGEDPALIEPGREPSSAVGVRIRRDWASRMFGDFPPEPMYSFHGRAFELLRLERLFGWSNAVVLSGMGGMGKTALAREASAWWLRTGRFERVVLHSFEIRAGAVEVVRGIGSAFEGDDFSRHAAEEQRRRAVELFRTRKVLLVWDNFESTLEVFQKGELPRFDEAEREDLRRLFEELTSGEITGRILVTCRPGATGLAGISELRLKGLDRVDSLFLLAAVLDQREIVTKGTGWEREQVEALLHLIADHPLSISLIAPHLGERTPEQIRDDLRSDLERFADDEATGRRDRSMSASLELSKRRLSGEARALLPYLAWFEGGVLELFFLEFAQIEPGDWEGLRAELEATALLRVEKLPWTPSAYLRFHPTLPYAARADTVPDPASAEERLFEVYLWVRRKTQQALRGAQPTVGMELMRLEEANVRAALGRALDRGERRAWELADTLNDYLERAGRLRERDTLAAWVRERLPEGEKLDKASCNAIRQHAQSLFSRGEAVKAIDILQELIARLEAEEGEAFQIATSYGFLAQVYVDSRRPDLAVPAAERAIVLLEKLPGDAARGNLSAAVGDLANSFLALGRFKEALASAERGVEIDRERGDQRDVAVGLEQIARIFAAQQRWTEADARYGEALKAARVAGDLALQGITIQNRAILQVQRGKPAKAVELGKEALVLFQRANHVGGEMHICDLLGTAEKDRGRLDAAEAWYARSRALAEAREDRRHLAVLAQNIGILHQRRAEQADDGSRDAHLLRAVGSIEESLDLELEMNNQVGAASSYSQLGVLHSMLGDLDRAAELLRLSLQIYKPLNHPEVYKVYRNLAQVAHEQGDAAAADWQAEYKAGFAELKRLRGGGDVSQELVQIVFAFAQTVYAARTQNVSLAPDVEEALAYLAALSEPLAGVSHTLSALAKGEEAYVPSGLPGELEKILTGLVEALGHHENS